MKYLVLDIGNVICEWNPDKLVGGVFDDPDAMREAQQVTIGHPDWLALDRGALALADAIANAQSRTSLPADKIADIYHQTPQSLSRLEPTIDAMHEAHVQGVKLYVLSNMAMHSWQWLQDNYDFWSLFTGFAVSCDIGLIKPEPAIYQHVLTSFSLNASDTVFIDDMAENVAGANAVGIRGVQLADRMGGGDMIRSLLLP